MKRRPDETRFDPLDEYFAEYLRAIDTGAALPQLRELQQRMRERLAAASNDDPVALAGLDAKLGQFFDDHTEINKMADAFRIAPALAPAAPVQAGRAGHGRDGVGECIGNYEIIKLLGKGGMGIVHQARHRQLSTWLVAIKRLLHDEPNLRARFDREIQALAALKHENIIAIYEFGEHQGQPYFVMEFTEGGSLADYLHSLGLPDWIAAPNPDVDLPRLRGTLLDERLRQSVELMVRLGSAMAHAHSRGVLHRDLKPGNVLLQTEPGQSPHLRSPRIADLGLAKLLSDDLAPAVTRPDAGLGTPYYAAPEQIDRSAPVNAHADIYSLGAILFELLTGEPPHRAAYGDSPSLTKVLEIKRREPPAPHLIDARVPLDLSAICVKCLRVEPGRRFAGAQEFVDELQRWLDGKPVLTRHQSTLEKWQSWYRREPLKAWLWTVSTAAVVLVLAAVIGWGAFGWQAAQRRFEIAQEQLDKERQDREQRARTAEQARKAIGRAIQLKGEARNFPQDGAKLQAALTAAREAEIIVKNGAADENLRQEVADLLQDLQREAADSRLLAAFDRARLHKLHLLIIPGRERSQKHWLDDEGHFLTKPAEKMFFAAFKDYGIDLDQMSNEDVVRALQARSPRVRGEAATALTELALLRGGLVAVRSPFGKSPLQDPAAAKWVRFFLIAQAMDDHPWRKKFRKTLLESNSFLMGVALEGLHSSAGKIDLPASNLCLLADLWGALEQPAWGRSLLFPAEQRRPSDALICCYLAFLETRRAEPSWPEVANWYRTAVALQPESAILRYSLGNAYYQSQKKQNALAHFKAATDLDPNFAFAWYNQGVILQETGKFAEAADAYRKVMQLGERFPEVLTNGGVVLAKMGDAAGALKLFEESIQRHPLVPVTHNHHGIVLASTGDAPGAIAAFRQALQVNEEYAEAHVNLADALRSLGKFAEALTHLERGQVLFTASRDERRDDVARRIEVCKRLIALDAKLPLMIRGEYTPDAAGDCLDAAQVAAVPNAHPAAVRLFSAAFLKMAPAFDDGNRFHAACSAALAGCEKGRGADDLTDKERTQLRSKALAWLHEELTQAKEWITLGEPKDIAVAVNRLQAWQRDASLACVRNEGHLAQLPDRERADWRRFWAEVQTQLPAESSQPAERARRDAQ